MEYGVFALLFSGVGPPILGAQAGIVAALQGWMRPILIAGVTLYVIGKMLWGAIRGNGNPLGDSLAIMVSGSIIVYAATEAAGLGPQARDLLLNGIFGEISRAALSVIGTRPVAANIFDDALGRAWGAGLVLYNKLPSLSIKGSALAIMIVFYWLFALGCIALAFLVWLTSFAMTALLVGFWPLGVGMFAFPWTRGLAWGWFRVTVANVLLQVLIVVTLSLLLGSINSILARVTSNLDNEIEGVGRLVASSVVFGLLAWVATQLPGLASSWAHGFTGFGQAAFARLVTADAGQAVASTLMGGGSSGPAASAPAPAHPPQAAMPSASLPGRSLG